MFLEFRIPDHIYFETSRVSFRLDNLAQQVIPLRRQASVFIFLKLWAFWAVKNTNISKMQQLSTKSYLSPVAGRRAYGVVEQWSGRTVDKSRWTPGTAPTFADEHHFLREPSSVRTSEPDFLRFCFVCCAASRESQNDIIMEIRSCYRLAKNCFTYETRLLPNTTLLVEVKTPIRPRKRRCTVTGPKAKF